MCNFFARNQKLSIVKGRWLGQPRNDRLCQECQEIEGKKHLVLICKKKMKIIAISCISSPRS